MKKYYALTFLALFFTISLNSFSQVVINEYSCSNLSQYVDDHSDYGDWLELYNTTGSPIDLSGYYLTDKLNKPMKWRIPNGITIPANGFVSFWCSGRDSVNGTNYHTNFKLSQTVNSPDKAGISNPSGVLIDSITNVVTQNGHSAGRITDGSASWGVFTTPTLNASNNTSIAKRYASKPYFSLAAGFYTGTQQIQIATSETNANIRFTIDGSEPLANSFLYSGPINVSSTTILKAKVFSSTANVEPSLMEFATYFINVNHTLPILSVAGAGMTTLLNGDDQLKPFGSIEVFGTDKLLKARSYGEYNKHGQDSWVCDQRSCDFVARDEMGYSKHLEYKFFNTTNRDEFQTFIIRASGDDNYPCGHNSSNEGSAHMRDGYIQNLADQGNLHLDVRRSTRVIMYVNGQYWGVYEVRERPDEHDYTKYYYDQDKYNLQYVLTWGNTWAEYGGQPAIDDWNAMKNYILNNNMADPAIFNYVDSKFNWKSLIDYYIVNSYTVCSDWLNYNTGVWRGLDTAGNHKKWGYILWDNDATFAFYINYTGIPDTSASAKPCDVENEPPGGWWGGLDDPEKHIAILNKLNANSTFHQYYVSRQADLLNTIFSCDYMLNYLDEYTAMIEPEMNQHANRWSGTYSEWQANVARLRYFIERRCANIQNSGMNTCYNLTGPYDVTVDIDQPGMGKVKYNSLTIDTFPWNARYYGGINSTLEAIPDSGNMFVNWTTTGLPVNPNATSAIVTLNVNQTDTITAHFSLLTSTPRVKGNNIDVNVYPTVFTDHLIVDYSIPERSPVKIELFDALGRKIDSIKQFETTVNAGDYALNIDMSKAHLAGGQYFVKFTAGNNAKSFKVVYLP